MVKLYTEKRIGVLSVFFKNRESEIILVWWGVQRVGDLAKWGCQGVKYSSLVVMPSSILLSHIGT